VQCTGTLGLPVLLNLFKISRPVRHKFGALPGEKKIEKFMKKRYIAVEKIMCVIKTIPWEAVSMVIIEKNSKL
jgi:hypothetical protein